MRIGIVLAAVPGYSETFFRSKIKFLQEVEGFTVHLFADSSNDNISWKDCPVAYAPVLSGTRFLGRMKILFQIILVLAKHPKKSLRLMKLNRKAGFNVGRNIKSLVQSSHILNHQLDWIHFGFATMAIDRENLARVIGAKMAVSFRGFDIAIYPLKHPNCYDVVWKTVNKVHVISDDLTKLAVANGCPVNTRIMKITPAIDIGKFTATEQPKGQAGPLKILTVARLHWKKGLEYTLDALYLLKQAGVDFNYTIVGQGEEFERLTFAVHQLDLSDRVNFAGKRTPEEVVALYKASDMYLQYSIQEGFCNAVLEAQAMGLLCIVSDAEGLSENVCHEKTGWVVPKRQPKMLAAKITQVISEDGNVLSAIRREAVRRVKEEFNLQKQKEAFVEFYTS